MADDRSLTLLMRDDRFDANNRKHRKIPLGVLANPGILASLFYPAEWLVTFLPAASFAAACVGILRRAKRRGKTLPEPLRTALESSVVV